MSRSTRNRPCDRLVSSALLALLFTGSAAAGQLLPVFLSDNHAETFGWIARTFDPDQRYQLVLVDAHSDASAAERSEEIRENLRRVPDLAARKVRVEDWRKSGRIQAFNWIEPLLPRPIEEVKWLAGVRLGTDCRREMTATAVRDLDGRLEVEPRSAGSFDGRWQTFDMDGFLSWNPGMRPVVLTIDLDFFAGMDAATRNATFETIWQKAMDWPGLAGVAFSVSRPWLANDAEADALVALASQAVERTRGAVLEVDASLDDRPDQSLKAEELGGHVPRWDAAASSMGLRACWLDLEKRLSLADRARNWDGILADWRTSHFSATITADGGEIDCDGVWRFPEDRAPVLRVAAPAGATGRVRWFRLEPARAAYDLIPETGLGKDFASASGRWIYEAKREIAVTGDFALAPDKWTAPGRVSIAAEIETADGWLPVPPAEIRLSRGSGFRAGLSECFGMPYVFGIAGVEDGGLSGVETGWGSDCANFLIQAWRRNGISLPWGDPGRLRSRLATLMEKGTLADDIAFTPEELTSGIAIDFGRHVAALWEDRPPLGKLGGNDLVAHHLGGFPEITDLATLAKTRPAFVVQQLPRETAACTVKAAGDVVLAEGERVIAEGFEKGDAALFVANLEGIPSSREPAERPRYDFRFPPGRLAWLKERGIDVVSLANNHAGDAGREGLTDGLAALHAAGIPVVGAGRNEQEACEPWRTERAGIRFAVFGACLVEALVATEDLPGVACLPQHEILLEQKLREEKASGCQVIVMMHGGDEYQSAVSDAQREWARWLVARGVGLVVGSHPHVVQRTETHAGSVIAYSLGNAVYPKSLKGAASGTVRAFRLPVGF